MPVSIAFGEVIADMELIIAPALVINRHCPRCHGSLFRRHDHRGEYVECLTCNREFTPELQERRPVVELPLPRRWRR